jgi:hypothetical protein
LGGEILITGSRGQMVELQVFLFGLEDLILGCSG